MYQPQAQPTQNLYPAQGGPIAGEPMPIQPGQPITPVAQPYPNPNPNQPFYQPPPIVNQQQPIVIYQQPLNLKTSPTNVTCPYCRNQVVTLVETNFNCLNCLFCCWAFYLWIIVELVRGKDLNCTDATHKCPSCGKVIGYYSSC